MEGEQQELQPQDLWNEEARLRENPAAETEPEAVEQTASETQAEDARLAELLSRIGGMEQSFQQLQQHVKTAEGRVAAFQREWDAAKKAQMAVDRAPSDQAMAHAAKSPEKWERMKQDFPEWAEAQEEFTLHAIRQHAPQTPVAQLDDESFRAKAAELGYVSKEELREFVAKSKIEDAHAGWEQTVNTPEFAKWFEAQPEDLKSLAASDRPADAIKLLDTYVETTRAVQQVKDERKERLQAAAGTPRRGAAQLARSVDEMSPQELWDYEARQREKARAA